MPDFLELTLQVRPATGEDASELVKLAGWLRGELVDLAVAGVVRLQRHTAPLGAKDQVDNPGLLLLRVEPKAVQLVLSKVTDWTARSDRMVEISAGGHTLTLGVPAIQQGERLSDGLPTAGTQVGRVRPQSETAVAVTPSVDANRDGSALELGDVLSPLRRRHSRPLIQLSPLFGREFRRTAAFALIPLVFGCVFAILLTVAVLAIAKHYHGFSISLSYPVHRIYQGIARYIIRVTPTPGSSHLLLVYTVYLAVLPVLFGVVFMHLRIGSARLILAAFGCVVFMVAPFIVVVTSIRVGSRSCGSWSYPPANPGSECFNALAIEFRIAFAAGIVGLAIPIAYLLLERRNGQRYGLLLGPVIACASFVIDVISSISNLARRRAQRERDVGRYLLPHERQIIAMRQHPAVLIGPTVLAASGLVAAGMLTAVVLHDNGWLVVAVWTACMALFVRMTWKAIDWTVTFFVVTSERILLNTGVLIEKVAMLPLTKVIDMSFHRSYTGRLLGFGDFIFESAGQNVALQMVDHIPYPEEAYLQICGLIFSDYDGESEDKPDSGRD